MFLVVENAMSFVDWCSETFEPAIGRSLPSHAPFTRSSILDIYVCMKRRRNAGAHSGSLAGFTAAQISRGRAHNHLVLGAVDFGLRAVRQSAETRYSAASAGLFAGEVFPVKHLRALCELWPDPRYFNLYGPTETNVCTYYEVPTPIPADRTKPYPIGYTCSHLRSRVVDDRGLDVPHGIEGELCIAGRGVMQGYWSLPEQTAKGFHFDASGSRWYRTGDIVTGPRMAATYLGRRDRMVKRRGYRVELGEIEAGFYRHARIKEAAVLAFRQEAGVSICVPELSRRDIRR
jgi:acyl-CoA synthetase (AMP-forming)/AMP-acid ligase II